MAPVGSLTLTYDALNEYGTFSEGDTINGKVTLFLLEATTTKRFFVKVKGDADVQWTTSSSGRSTTHSAHRRYFKRKQFFIPENSRETVIPKGIHVYNFSFRIPLGSMPSSFRGPHGKIVYKLEAKLSRSWKPDLRVVKDIRFVSKHFSNLQSLMLPQVDSTTKEMGLFSHGQVHMEATIDRRAYAPGETVVIVAKINNTSSRDMTPILKLTQHVWYRSNGSEIYRNNVIQKVSDNCIEEKTERTVRMAMTIPHDQTQTIRNCEIISVAYNLKMSLDIRFAFDPKIIFPLVIIPPDLVPDVSVGPYPASAVGGRSNSDFSPSVASVGCYRPFPRSGSIRYPRAQQYRARPPREFSGYGPSRMYSVASVGRYPPSPCSYSIRNPRAPRYTAPPSPVYPGYGPPSMYPAQPTHISRGYNNQVPQQTSSYGSPFSSSSSSSVLHPLPTAPTFHPSSSPSAVPALSISPTAPAFNLPPHAPFPPPPSAPPSYPSLFAPPTFNISPTAQSSMTSITDTDWLSQNDEAPPAYSLLFPSSTERSDAR